MNDIKITFGASAIRPNLWEGLLNSLKDNELKYEVIFVGDVRPQFDISKYPEMKYIYATVKPAQCYSIAFNNSEGHLLSWFADDCVYSPKAVDIMYNFFKSFNTDKLVTAFRTIEDGKDITEVHRFRGRDMSSPRMAPFGVVDRKLFHSLGGYDKRFLCGQSENDVVMRVLEIGGRVEVCPNASAIVAHQEAHREGTKFRTNNYHIDRRALENEWVENGVILSKRKTPVQSFDNTTDITTKTQGENGNNQW